MIKVEDLLASIGTIPKAALKGYLAEFQADCDKQQAILNKSSELWVEETTDIVNKLFARWKSAAEWMKETHMLGRRDLVVFSPIFRPRHLWSYLHISRTVKNAMDRRGPNSRIQGFSSDIGYVSSWLIAQEVWKTFTSRGIDLGMRQTNAIHDSQLQEVDIKATPIAIYLVEHGMVTLPLNYYRDVFGIDISIPFGFDMEIGLDESTLSGWEGLRFDTMAGILEAKCKEAGLGNKDISDCLHNWNEIAKVRRKELKLENQWTMTLQGKHKWYKENMKGLKTC
jgi:hypothetical protein